MPSFFPGLLLVFSLASSATTLPIPFETIANQADAARTQNRVPEAIRLYREGTELRPSWAEGWWYLGSLFYDQDRFSEATPAFRHLLANHLYRSSAHAFLGLCEYETGRYDDALTQFRAWAATGWVGTPELGEVGYYHFALLLAREGNFIESLSLLTSIAQRQGENPEIAEAMGLASLRMRYLPENYPPELRERIWLAGEAALYVLYAQRKPEQYGRADDYAARLEARYGSQPEVHAFRGTLYQFEKKPADAEREYREELKISPGHLPSLVALVGLDLDKGDAAEAGVFARQVVAASEKSAEAHLLLGRVLFETGDIAGSVKEWEIAKQLAPENPAVRSHLAMAYGKMGESQKAKTESAAYLTLKKKAEATTPTLIPPDETVEKTH